MRLIFTLFLLLSILTIPAQTAIVREIKLNLTETTADTLDLDAPRERALAGGETHDFHVKAETGEAFLITVEQRDIDVAVGLSAPAGEKISEVDFSYGVDGTERLFFVAPQAGLYRIEVRSLVKNAKAGGYRIQVLEKRLATERDRRENLAAQKFYAGQTTLKKATAESYREALKNFDEAISIWQETGGERGTAQALFLKIDAFFNTGDMNAALDACERSLPLWRKLGDRIFEAETLYSKGVVYGAINEPAKALASLEEARTIFRNLKNSMGEGKVLSELGFGYYLRGDYRSSLKMFEQALPLRRAANDLSGTGGALMAIGIVYAYLGEPDKSLRYYEDALPAAEQAGDTNLKANILSNVADVSRDLGNFDKAFEYSRKSLDLMRQTGNRYAEAGTLHQYGDLYRVVGDYERAVPLLEQALELAKATNRLEVEPLVFYSLGMIYREQDNYEKSNRSFQAALEISRKLQNDYYIASQLNELAFNLIALKRYDEALANAKEAGALFAKAGYAGGEVSALRNVGSAYYEKGDPARALETFRTMLSRAGQIKHRNFEANAHYYIALVARGQKDFAASLGEIEKAVKILEASRASLSRKDFRASFLAENRKFYELYIEVLLDLSEGGKNSEYVARAFEISEQSRARTLVELLKESGADIRAGANPALLARERETNNRLRAKAERQTKLLSSGKTPNVGELNALVKEISDLTEESEKLAAQIRRANPDYAALTQPAPLKTAEIQALLDKETILLEYALGEKQSALWLVANDSVSIYQLPKREEIEIAARSFYESLKTAGNAPDAKAGNFLSETLLGPIGGKLAGKRLAVVTEGALQYVPFAALPNPAAENRFLIETNEIVNLPSASTLAVLRRSKANRQPAPKTLAIFADPVFSPDDPRVKTAAKQSRTIDARLLRSLEESAENASGEEVFKTIPRLPFSRREAEAIASGLKPDEILKAVDFGATASAAINRNLANYRLVHFATHGLLNSKNPELSGLVLSLVNEKGEAQNGFLRLSDIYNLRLNADLVVLSACRTALGKDVRGEGLIGLTRGFMYAGSPRVVASLWKVDDAATAELMKRFYQNMLTGKMRAPEALRTAQIEMSRDERYRSPYFWAAFTLQGEWK